MRRVAANTVGMRYVLDESVEHCERVGEAGMERFG